MGLFDRKKPKQTGGESPDVAQFLQNLQTGKASIPLNEPKSETPPKRPVPRTVPPPPTQKPSVSAPPVSTPVRSYPVWKHLLPKDANQYDLKEVAQSLASVLYDVVKEEGKAGNGMFGCGYCRHDCFMPISHLTAPLPGSGQPVLACVDCYDDRKLAPWDGNTSRLLPDSVARFTKVATLGVQQIARQMLRRTFGWILHSALEPKPKPQPPGDLEPALPNWLDRRISEQQMLFQAASKLKSAVDSQAELDVCMESTVVAEYVAGSCGAANQPPSQLIAGAWFLKAKALYQASSRIDKPEECDKYLKAANNCNQFAAANPEFKPPQSEDLRIKILARIVRNKGRKLDLTKPKQ